MALLGSTLPGFTPTQLDSSLLPWWKCEETLRKYPERYISLPSTALDVTSRDLNLELGQDLLIMTAFQSPNSEMQGLNTVIFLS